MVHLTSIFTSFANRFLRTSTSRDSIHSLIGNVGIALGGLSFSIIVARSLAPNDFGTFSALISLALLLSSIGDLGITSALINFLPKFPSDRQHLISLTFWVSIISSLLFALITLSLIPFGSAIIPNSSPLFYLLVALITLFYILEGFAQGVLTAEKRFLSASLLQITDSGIKLLILLGLFLNQQVSISSALLATATSALIATLIGLKNEFKNLSFFFPRHYLRRVFSFSRWIALSRLFNIAITRIDVLLLASLSTAYQAGIYAVSARMAMFFPLLVSTITSVTSTRFSRYQTSAQLMSYLKRLLPPVSLLSLFMLFVALISGQVIRFVFGPAYTDSVWIFRLMTLAMMPYIFSSLVTSSLIYFFNEPHYVAKLTIIQMAVLIVLEVILIPRLGALGPVISLGLSNVLLLIVSTLHLHRLSLQSR